ncbi:MAG: ABC transporter permease [Roseburia sp.]
MFLHSFCYAFKQLLRQKQLVFWTLFFPIVLATMFHLAFSGLTEDEQLQVIPVAAVKAEENPILTDIGMSSPFTYFLDQVSAPGENQFLSVTYTTEEDALTLLEHKEIIGILYEGDLLEQEPVRLTISSEMTNFKLEQSILTIFVEQFNMISETITNIAMTDPNQLPAVIEQLSRDTTVNTEVTYSARTTEASLTYFFNLIAMTCLFASMSGMLIAVHNQGNLSALGARRCIAPASRMQTLFGELCANALFQFSCAGMSLLYLLFVLKVDFGPELGYVALATLVGCFTGISLGFLVGSIGTLTDNVKMGILMSVTMICCFLSGLMVNNMRILVAQIAPWFNHINPAALIADSFYSLTVYPTHSRYFANLGTLLVMSAVFFIGGLICTRRKTYAAI